jgi:putative effector of murein hydrolase
MGAAAHAVGTAQVMQRSRRLGAYSSIGLIMNGTLTGLLTPYLLQLLGY